MIKKLFITTVLFLSIVSVSKAQTSVENQPSPVISADYVNSLYDMLDSMGVTKTFQTAVDSMLEVQKDMYPEIDDATWERLRQEFQKISLMELTEKLAPVYAEYLSSSDLNQVTQFYQTPVGKKLSENLPEITQKSMAVGRDWGYQIGLKLAETIQEEQSKEIQ